MEEEKRTRYERLKTIVIEVETSGYTRKNTEWYDSNFNIMEEYRSEFSNFSYVDSEISNKEFRQKASLVESLLTNLMNDYKKYRWFGLYDYIRLNRNLIWLSDYSLEFYNGEENDLCALLGKMSVN